MKEADAIGVVGLGYVGTVVAASLASMGRSVIGVDRRAEIVEAIGRGVAPIPEPGLAERITRALSLGTLRCTTDLDEAARSSVATLVCVGTPAGPGGELVEDDVLGVCEAIARAVPAHRAHTIVIRSTVPPGLYARAMERLREVLGSDAGERVTLALNPEFLREGSALHDHEEPELVVYATEHEPAARFLEALYAEHADRVHRTDPRTAEVLKLVNNAWHALKVAFANEVSRVSRPIGVDPFEVMRLVCADTKLNTSSAYLRPGLPFGGACLVKDVASLAREARVAGTDAPLLGSILASNDAHLEHLVAAIMTHRPRRVAIVGVGFKSGASDVRDSAAVRLVRRLLDAGVHVAVADAGILEATVPPLGLDALRAALGDERAQPVSSVAEALEGADVVVVGHPTESDRRALVALSPRAPVLDAAGELARERARTAPSGPRVLIVPTHPGVQYHFCRVGVPIHFLGNWDQFHYWRPRPPNVINVLPRFEEAHLAFEPEDYARLLDDPEVGWPDRYDLAWLMFNWQVKLFWNRPGKKLYRVAKVAELERDLWAELLARDDFRVVSFYPNTVEWLRETFGVEVPYVPLGLDPEAYGPAGGEDANILSIIHSYRDRGWHHHAWVEATAGLPTLHVDHLDPDKPVFEYADLQRALRRARLYLHDGEQEYTITLIEAMMTGLPLVSFRIPGIERYVEHGVNGLIGESAAQIREHCRLLLADEALARRMGAASRAKAEREFSEDRWVRDWRALLSAFAQR